MTTSKYSDATRKHFANLRDYLESQIYEMDYSNKFGNLRTMLVSIEEKSKGSYTEIRINFRKSPTLVLTRNFDGYGADWDSVESTFLGLKNTVPHDEFLEDLTTKLLISMIHDKPNHSKLVMTFTSTKLSR